MMSRLDAQKLADLVGSPFAAQLVAAMPEPAVIVSSDERAAAANKPALTLLPGLRVGDPLVLGLRAPDVIDARRRVMASGEAETVQWSERVPVERLFDVTVAPLATADGEVVATLITLRDQTEARRVERLRVDFIANASHELRTPLASLVGFIETLQAPTPNHPAPQSRPKHRPGHGHAIAKHILPRHRGSLTITSRVNQGSSFVAMVPLPQKP